MFEVEKLVRVVLRGKTEENRPAAIRRLNAKWQQKCVEHRTLLLLLLLLLLLGLLTL